MKQVSAEPDPGKEITFQEKGKSTTLEMQNGKDSLKNMLKNQKVLRLREHCSSIGQLSS